MRRPISSKVFLYTWLYCLIIFTVLVSFNLLGNAVMSSNKGWAGFFASVLLIDVFIGVVAFIGLIFTGLEIKPVIEKVEHKEEKEIKKDKTRKINPWFITSSFLLLSLLYFIVRTNPNISRAFSLFSTSTALPTPKAVELDGNKVWDLVNSWERKQGYQPYVKDEELCHAGDKMLLDKSILSDDNWLSRTGLSSSYRTGWLSQTDAFSEQFVVDSWTSNSKTVKTLRDYYKYGCARCKYSHCILMVANIGVTTPSLIQNTAINSSDPITNCNISSNCGGGTKQMKRSDCNNSICCQIGDKWYFYLSRSQCDIDQNNYYNKGTAKINQSNPAAITGNVKIDCSFSSGQYQFNFGQLTYEECRIKSDEYWQSKKNELGPTPEPNHLQNALQQMYDLAHPSFPPIVVPTIDGTIHFNDPPPPPTVPVGYGYSP